MTEMPVGARSSRLHSNANSRSYIHVFWALSSESTEPSKSSCSLKITQCLIPGKEQTRRVQQKVKSCPSKILSFDTRPQDTPI